MAQLASARLSEREGPGSIFNVCFDFPLIRVAIALNTRKTDPGRWQASIDSSLVGTEGTTDVK